MNLIELKLKFKYKLYMKGRGESGRERGFFNIEGSKENRR